MKTRSGKAGGLPFASVLDSPGILAVTGLLLSLLLHSG